MMLNILYHTGLSPQYRVICPQISIVQRLKTNKKLTKHSPSNILGPANADVIPVVSTRDRTLAFNHNLFQAISVKRSVWEPRGPQEHETSVSLGSTLMDLVWWGEKIIWVLRLEHSYADSKGHVLTSNSLGPFENKSTLG